MNLDPLHLEWELGEALDAARREAGIAGLAAVAVYAGRTVWSAGFGSANLERETPVTRKTVFTAAAITELLARIALLQSRDAGKLALDDAIELYLPELTGNFPVRMTLQDLASSTSPNVPTKADVPGPAFAPGEALSLVVGIIERVEGRSYEEIVMDRIFSPLGMEFSGFDANAGMRMRLATGYGGAKVVAIQESSEGGKALARNPLTNAVDLSNLLLLTLSHMPAVLSQTSVYEMQAQVHPHGRLTPSWDVSRSNGTEVLYRLGADSGFISIIAVVPELDVGLGILTNAGAGQISPMRVQMMALDCAEGLTSLIAGERSLRPDPRV